VSREFSHAVTGRSITVAEGSRTERLVEADSNWSETKVEAKKAPAKRVASRSDKSD